MATEQLHPETTQPAVEEHGHNDNVTHLFGRVIPLPVYTVVFITLAIITLIEVIIAELPSGFLGTVLLVGLSGIKAVLVVLFYMHLREDSRMFAIVLIIPVVMAAISVLFLATIPTGNY